MVSISERACLFRNKYTLNHFFIEYELNVKRVLDSLNVRV